MKKGFLLLLVLCLVICMIPLFAQAETNETNFTPFKLNVVNNGSLDGYKRIVVDKAAFPFEVVAGVQMVNCTLNGKITYSGDNEEWSKEIPMKDVKVERASLREDGNLNLEFHIPAGYTIELKNEQAKFYVYDLTLSPKSGEAYKPPVVKPMEFKEGKTYIVLGPDGFTGNGSWGRVKDEGVEILMGEQSGGGQPQNPANIKICLPKDGVYKIYTYAKDHTTNPGARHFEVQLDGIIEYRTGNHGQMGYHWQTSESFSCFGGEYQLKLADTSGNYARCAAIVITDDLDFSPTEDASAVGKMIADMQYKEGDLSYTPGAVSGRPATDIAVMLNGEWMTFDVDPVLMNDRTMVPFRAIFEALGCTVSWDDVNEIAKGQRNGLTISLPIGSTQAKVGIEAKTLDQPAVVVNDRTLVPLRFVSEALGAQVKWDDPTQTVTILAAVPAEMILFGQESYTDVGTWNLESGADGAFLDRAFRGTSPSTAGATIDDADPSNNKPAVAEFYLAQGGTYKVWARSRDFATNQQGDRFFQIAFNDQPIMPHKYGTHGGTGYAWACGGTVELAAGANTMYVHDTSGFYARYDAVLLTKDMDYIPAESYNSLTTLVQPYSNRPEGSSTFPKYANEQAVPTESTVIENADTKVVFYKVPTSKGQVIQNEIYAKYNGAWVLTKARNEDLGYQIVRADKASATSAQGQYGMNTSFTLEGRSYGGLTSNIFAAGDSKFFVPTDYIVNGNSVVLTAQNETGTVNATWSLDNDSYPLVSIDFTPAKDGYYSIVAWEGKGFTEDQYEYALAPFRVQFKRVPEEPTLMTEQYLFTPMGTYTLYKNNEYNAYSVTKGIVFDPSWIPQRWVYKDNGILGITMKDGNGLFRGSAVAPILGNPDSKMAAGSTFNLRVRIVSDVADWFENYSNTVTNLFDVTDYRKNYQNSLNETIFNIHDLMLDDKYSGWDPYDKAHYNMEGWNATSVANSMEALQVYLLTENEEILEKRAIPTIANMLTRGSIHFNRIGVAGPEGSYWAAKTEPDTIGNPVAGFNANVVLGMYEMTRGGVPYLFDYGMQKGQSSVTNSYGSIAPFSNDLTLYKYTGDKTYLDKAVKSADEYLQKVVYAENTAIPTWTSFIYISYYPNMASLLDIYEVTKDQKYLDAAEYVAQWMTTGLWVPGVDGEKATAMVTVNDQEEISKRHHYGTETSSHMYWAGSKQMRVGREDIQDTTHSNDIITSRMRQVEGWLPSRVGLGVEQASTFGASGNIVMQTFAGDFMRLAAYTGNDFLATAARNAIVGRFRSYDGYYRTAFMTYQQESNYPVTGPDYTGIYWHHIPPFLAMLEDFLINQTFNWSNQNIEFPGLRQQGYAYFNSNQYGHQPGKFYDETDMWPWLARGVVNPDSIQIDWLAARKDGVLGLAFMNEDHVATTTTITLGELVNGGASYSGTADLYDATGKIGSVEVTNGAFTLTIPAQSLQAVIMKIDTVQAPAIADIQYSVTDAEIGATVSEHKNGKGYTLQMAGDSYFAYIYTTYKPAQVTKATLTYSIGGGAKQTAVADVYPYEFIIKVDDVDAEFTYELSVTKKAGGEEKLGGGTLMTAKKSAEKGIKFEGSAGGTVAPGMDASDEAKALNFNATEVKLLNQGRGSDAFRFVVSKDSLPFEPNANNVVGLRLTATIIDGGEQISYSGAITGYEDREDKCVFVATSGGVDVAKYNSTSEGNKGYTWDKFTIHPVQ